MSEMHKVLRKYVLIHGNERVAKALDIACRFQAVEEFSFIDNVLRIRIKSTWEGYHGSETPDVAVAMMRLIGVHEVK